MVDLSGPNDEQSVNNVPINPDSNNPIAVDQTTYLETVNGGGVDEDGFEISIDLSGSEVTEKVNIALVLDQSGSTAASSGTDFNGNGMDDSILTAELYAAQELFDAYIAAGYNPDEVSITLVSYTNDATVRGTFRLDQEDEFEAALTAIGNEGPLATTNYVAGLDAVGTAWTGANVDPADTNVVVFLSDGFPFPGGQDISGAAEDLEDDWGAEISGIGIGANSSLTALNQLDNTGSGATQVLSGQELLDVIVQPLTDAEFLRFEIVIDGVDANGDPMQQTITLPLGDPNVITTQLGWSVDCLPLDPAFDARQDITVTVNSYFAEDPGNPGSGEQVVTTIHEVPLVVCFTPGTRILTPTGPRNIEELEAGDRVVTRDHGSQCIRWIGATKLSLASVSATPALRPILIKQGALGPDLPESDLRVSRQHRILVRDWRSEVMFGVEGGVLVPAFTLCNDSSIVEEHPTAPVTYIHMAFDNHEVVYANGVEAESFHPAERTVSGMNAAQRAELFELFPELQGDDGVAFDTARRQPATREARVLAR